MRQKLFILPKKFFCLQCINFWKFIFFCDFFSFKAEVEVCNIYGEMIFLHKLANGIL